MIGWHNPTMLRIHRQPCSSKDFSRFLLSFYREVALSAHATTTFTYERRCCFRPIGVYSEHSEDEVVQQEEVATRLRLPEIGLSSSHLHQPT